MLNLAGSWKFIHGGHHGMRTKSQQLQFFLQGTSTPIHTDVLKSFSWSTNIAGSLCLSQLGDGPLFLLRLQNVVSNAWLNVPPWVYSTGSSSCLNMILILQVSMMYAWTTANVWAPFPVLSGRKRWKLLPPQHTPLLMDRFGRDMAPRFDSEGCEGQFPNLKQACALVIEIEQVSYSLRHCCGWLKDKFQAVVTRNN